MTTPSAKAIAIPQDTSYGSGKNTTVELDEATGELVVRNAGYYEDDVRIPGEVAVLLIMRARAL